MLLPSRSQVILIYRRRQSIIPSKISWKKNGVIYFSPESPNLLLKRHEEKKIILEELIPELRSYSEQNDVLPYSKLFSGKEGVKIALDDVIESAKQQKIHTIYSFLRPEFMDHFPKIGNRWIKEREKHGIFIKVVRPVLKKGDNDHGYENNTLRETRVMPEDYPIKGSLFVCGRKTTLFSIKNYQMYAATIDSEPFSSMFENMFQYIWKTLPKT